MLAWLILIARGQILRRALDADLRKIPGPLKCHLTNLPLKFAVLTGQRMHLINDLHQRYGGLRSRGLDVDSDEDKDRLFALHPTKYLWLISRLTARSIASVRPSSKVHGTKTSLRTRPTMTTAVCSGLEMVGKQRLEGISSCEPTPKPP